VDELGRGVWDFQLPVGSGYFANIIVTVAMDPSCNRVLVKFERKLSDDNEELLNDLDDVELIIRPDIENRNFHSDTKAMLGPQDNWGYAVRTYESGFSFSPSADLILRLSMESATFCREDEWSYSNFHPIEASRGLEAYSDLFSPGYFKVRLAGGASSILEGSVNVDQVADAIVLPEMESSFEGILKKAMLDFVVNRDDLKTVIAGYPWFLDWGRDTLICVRGLISTGDPDILADVSGILQAFAKFEENGTLPNMIHGNDAANRETTDAPLWFFIAVQDYCRQLGDYEFLRSKPSGSQRCIEQILVSIAENYISGTPNGIVMDKESGLVYSPSHFTWMDTNYPAGTPRAGYPIEIQALWYGALNFLAEITADCKWSSLAELVQSSIRRYFVSDRHDFLSDCLHAHTFAPAQVALADDALRSNQLLAVTLGAITDEDLMKKIVHSSEELLVPGAIRSLADRPVEFGLSIYASDGRQLNDGHHPFWGRYEGDEDSRRKPAYHNGTAWTWPFASWAEAYFMLYGDDGRESARAILLSSKELLKTGCVGHLPEILDGASPHSHRGCDAQAWGVTELYRVWEKVK
jgi:predicted glycogen debranching enzyme